MRFLCVLKIYHVRIFIVWKKGFGTIPRRCGIRSKPQHKYRKLVLYKFLKIAICVQDQAYVRMQKATYVSWFIHTHSEGFFWHFFFFLKLIYLLIKRYITHFNTSQVNLNFWLGPKPTLGLRIQYHWGTGARVVRGTKCGVYIGLCVDTCNPVWVVTIWSPCASFILYSVRNFTR